MQASSTGIGFRYRAVAEDLKAQIIRGVYKPGERFPRQHDLAAEHNVAFATLKKALDILEKDGFVVRRIGRGTYAALPESSRPTALVIDNDEAILDMFTDVLGTGGWKCVTADSGPAALKHLQQSQFDLVIITGYPDSDLMSEALQTGPFAVMKKPFPLKDLRWMLSHSVQRSANAAMS